MFKDNEMVLNRLLNRLNIVVTYIELRKDGLSKCREDYNKISEQSYSICTYMH